MDIYYSLSGLMYYITDTNIIFYECINAVNPSTNQLMNQGIDYNVCVCLCELGVVTGPNWLCFCFRWDTQAVERALLFVFSSGSMMSHLVLLK